MLVYAVTQHEVQSFRIVLPLDCIIFCYMCGSCSKMSHGQSGDLQYLYSVYILMSRLQPYSYIHNNKSCHNRCVAALACIASYNSFLLDCINMTWNNFLHFSTILLETLSYIHVLKHHEMYTCSYIRMLMILYSHGYTIVAAWR